MQLERAEDLEDRPRKPKEQSRARRPSERAIRELNRRADPSCASFSGAKYSPLPYSVSESPVTDGGHPLDRHGAEVPAAVRRVFSVPSRESGTELLNGAEVGMRSSSKPAMLNYGRNSGDMSVEPFPVRTEVVAKEVAGTTASPVANGSFTSKEYKRTAQTTEAIPSRASRDHFQTPRVSVELPRHRSLKALIAILAALFVIVGSTALAGTYLVKLAAGGSSPGHGEVVFTVADGQSLSEISESLEKEGIISSSTSFLLYLRLSRKSPVVRAGEYRMRYGMGAEAVLAVFEAGPQVRYKDLTFVPGLTVRQQASRVESDLGLSGEKFAYALNSNVDLAGFPDAPNAEGLCFPDTYRVDANTKEPDLASRCLRHFDDVFSALDKSRLSSLGVTKYQIVIVASLIEREAKLDSERPLIASVIYNRLRRGMKLDIDATVLYAMGEHKERLTYKDLEIDSPYNTYKNPGLPPTPIATPSRAALEGALNPANTDYLYYVLTDPSGVHAFTSSASEFERLKADAISRGVF